jgi:hypothetical protein
MDYLTAKLPDLITEANNVAAEAKSTFGGLTPTRLNWKPSPERWSVAQCFDHLLTSNKGLLSAYRRRACRDQADVLATHAGAAGPRRKAAD